MTAAESIQPNAEPVRLNYEADLCGSIEQALKGLQGYGIMALELIQNADDAGARTLCFDARQNALVVTNDAEFSSCGLTSKRCPWEGKGDPDGLRRPCNFHAISRMGGRSKIHAAEQIGRFGIGFVSVYQITDTPIIRSAGTRLRLNPLTGEAMPEIVDFRAGTQFELPWAANPSEIRNALNASPTPPDVALKVVTEVLAVLRSSLFFLRHIQRVEVRESGALRLTVDIERSTSGITLAYGPEQRVERWLVISRDATDLIEERNLLEEYETLTKLDRSRAVSVAIPVEGETIEGGIYAYLPTQQKSGMPLHINADFFPHASRQNIVLKGEGHERYWNEALLATAAAILGENFVVLRDALGHAKLWQLGSAAFQLRGSGAFAEFWSRFSSAAKSNESVWTTREQWHVPAGVQLAPEQMPTNEQTALLSMGLEFLDPSLRPHWTVLTSLGAGELRLSTVTDRLEALKGVGPSGESPYQPLLWAAIARLIEIDRNRRGFDAVIKRLKAASFLIEVDGAVVSPDDVWRMPHNVQQDLVSRFIPECPIVQRDVLAHANLASLIDEYTLEEFAEGLAAKVHSSESAVQRIGLQPEAVRSLYVLLTSFPVAIEGTNVGAMLANTPLLRTSHGFVTPSRGQLPGGFVDPTGHFEFIDTSLFPPGMEDFARNVLDVSVLSFHEYIDDHLEEILAREPTREQYQALLVQIVERKNALDDRGSLEALAQRAFVRSRAGEFVRPRECYFWTAQLNALLGEDALKWVDNSWMPPAPHGPRLQDLFEDRLGMPTSVAARHMVGRIDEVAEGGIPDEVADSVTPIIRHIIERWGRFGEEDLEDLRELQNIAFLPAVVGDERDAENLYRPTEVYRAARARGFNSQVPVIDLTPLRQTGAMVQALLDLLEVLEEPDTNVIVAHLQHCMRTNTEPSDLTYTILNERVEGEDDRSAIDSLAGSAFIYSQDLKRFLTANQVFWMPPPFRGYWWAASGRMGQRGSLYRRLGVRDYPESGDYAQLMLDIVGKSDLGDQDISIHSRCLGSLCDMYDRSDPGVVSAIEALESDAFLLNVDGDPIWPEDAVWIDSEQLSAPFGTELNYRLVQPPNVAWSGVIRLFRRLAVRPISEIARVRLAAEPDRIPVDQASESLRERADLVLWLAPDTLSRAALRSILSRLEIQLSTSLRTQVEINEFDPPVLSPVSSAAAFYEQEPGILHVEGSSMHAGWPAAFRAIFAEIERYCPTADVKPLIMTASLIMLTRSREEAELALRSSGYRPPEDETEDIAFGEFLGDGHEEGVSDEMDHNDRNQPPETDAGDGNTLGASRSASEVQEGIGPGEALGEETCNDNESRQVDEAPYGSKPGTGEFGAEEEHGGNEGRGVEGQDGINARYGQSRSGQLNLGRQVARGERKTRTSRMLAYVSRAGSRSKDDAETSGDGSDISNLVDIAAIRAALKYEKKHGRSPEEQPHGNPGYDIISTASDGQRRLIEVKGLEGDWTERGIKLSHVQYGMAEQHPDEYWVYVVENARDLDRQRVSALANPFLKVEEYWFDHNWRDIIEETASSREFNLSVGASVYHDVWRTGMIVNVEQRGIAIMVKIDFGINGVKYVPLNSSLRLVD